MYVYLEPKGGINDCLVSMSYAIDYCKRFNRILLIDGQNSYYKINFANYFNIPFEDIILDTDKIQEIISKNNVTFYPSIFNNNVKDLISYKDSFILFTNNNGAFDYNGIILDCPSCVREEDVIVLIKSGGGDGYNLFKELNLNPIIKNTAKERFAKLKKPYLAIQIRNTDYKCNYVELFDSNKEEIMKYEEIYISTDDKTVLNYFREINLSFKNFTTFPEGNYPSLHFCELSGHTKLIDLFSDLLIVGMSDKLLSNSSGGFFNSLLLPCYNNKEKLKEQFEL
jgi:hypothetical protein